MKILVIGGTRYFGKRLVKTLIDEDHEVTVLSRGQTPDQFAGNIERIHCDRQDAEQFNWAVKGKAWDVVIDQICMNAKDAQAACEIFDGHTNFYVFTSTQSVYSAGANLKEEAFNAKEHHFSEIAEERTNYAEAKRQAEAVFSTQAHFKVAKVRLPIVLGEDDYTKRLAFHVDRVCSGKPIYFPNPQAKINFVYAEDAAQSIYQIVEQRLAGPINIAAAIPIRLRELMDKIEVVTNKSAVLATEPGTDNWSPFGIEGDWYMNVERAAAQLIKPTEIDQWLPSLIKFYFNSHLENV